MDKKPKTKEIVQSLKEHTAADVKDKALAAGIKSKDRVLEQIKTEATNQVPQRQRTQDTQSPESYATDHVEDKTQSIIENTAYTGERAARYGVRKIKEHRAEKQAVEQAKEEVFADERLPEDLRPPESHETSSTEHTAPSSQVQSHLPSQEPATTNDSNLIRSDTHETTSPPDTVQSSVSSDKRTTHTRREIGGKDTAQTEANMESEASDPAANRIRQKQKPAAKEKENTAAGQVKAREKSIRSNEGIKGPKVRNDISVQDQNETRFVLNNVAHQGIETDNVPPSGKPIRPAPKKELLNAKSQERPQPLDNESPNETLTDSPSAEVADSASVKTKERAIKRSNKETLREKEDVRPRMKENVAKKEADTAPIGTDTPKAPGETEKKGAPRNTKALSSTKTELKKKPSEPAIAGTVDTGHDVRKRPALKQKKRTPPKVRQKPTLPKAIAEKPISKTPPAGLKRINQRDSVTTGIRSIKMVSEKTKEAEKATSKNARAAKKAARTAKQAEERTKRAVQTAKQAAQATAKAVVKAVKASAEAISGLAELLGVSAPVVLLIIIVCLIAAIGGTCFGIFLSNDKSSGSEMTMSQAITQLTTDYYDSITKIQGQFNYDELEVKGSTAINWKDVLTIYAVKYTNDSDGFEVVTLDKKKLKKIKRILLDMNPCTGVVVEKVVPVTKTITDSKDQKITTTTYETQKVLIVTAVHVGATEQAKLYDFSKEAKVQVKELLSPDYAEMWNELIGSGGEIIISNSTHTPNFIFTWPLDGDYRISSEFGTRTDPINGVVKTHGGTDIAAATGTPILAAADGVVEMAGYNAGGYGYYVKLSHGDGYETLYGHCSVLLVSTGQTVKQGQVIAKVGSTGHSTGPHLHFEVRYNGNKVNPMQFFE